MGALVSYPLISGITYFLTNTKYRSLVGSNKKLISMSHIRIRIQFAPWV
jgi:hypothetical protein